MKDNGIKRGTETYKHTWKYPFGNLSTFTTGAASFLQL